MDEETQYLYDVMKRIEGFARNYDQIDGIDEIESLHRIRNDIECHLDLIDKEWITKVKE